MRYGRKAFGAQRKVSSAVNAQYIVESIRSKQVAGIAWAIDRYTRNPETIAAVTALLQK